MKSVFTDGISDHDAIIDIVENFDRLTEVLVEGKRNSIRLYTLHGRTFAVKSFKTPGFFNKVVYRFFRKSKAQRSFEYAKKLLELEIGTPKPIAYFENHDFAGLLDSYYISEYLKADLLFKDLVSHPDLPGHENILRQFTVFSFELHRKGVEFLDHSPGNTLITKDSNGNCRFFLVDLNRMIFHETIPFERRMKNLSRLTPKKDMVAIMSNEYAKHSGEPEQMIFSSLWKFTQEFQSAFHRRRRIKKKIKFWKK
ncbi:MAG TPA: lipopolysaccharide kinase InaA family protein [Flavobacterium sp.]|jgi:hypothetical protein